MTLSKQISLFTEENVTFSQVDFRVNPTQQQGSDWEQQMTATSGRKCLEQFEKFNQPGLWAKMFVGLLIGMEGWYSTKCRLTWKLKATKSHRFYFQLVPSTLPTEGTGFGLLPTPVVMDSNTGDLGKIDQRRIRAKESSGNGNGFGQTIGELANRGLLPTPQARDEKNGSRLDRGRSTKDLNDLAVWGMLPTPATRDYKGARTTEALEASGRSETNSLPDRFHQPGKTSQLNPRFVEEMMGFPPDWTLLPFLRDEHRGSHGAPSENGDKNPLKPTEMP